MTDEFTRRLESQLRTRPAAGARTREHAPLASDSGDAFSRRLADAAARSSARESAAAREPKIVHHAAASEPAAADTHEHDAQPVGDGQYEVRDVDCLSRIAAEFGHLPDTIWNDPANATLREARPNREVLLAGDRVYVPPLRQKHEPGAAETRNRFRRKGSPSSITLVLKHNDQPRANQPYRLEIEGHAFEGVTDAYGQIIRPVPPGATRGRLRIGDDAHEHVIEIGRLEPVEAIRGVQQRLNNLGFDCGKADGVIGPRTRQALIAFQRKTGLEATGRADEATRQKLVEQHAS